jgi:hypothetical protein
MGVAGGMNLLEGKAATGPSRPHSPRHSAPQPPDAPDTHHGAPKPYSARTDRPGPTWAQPDSEEAA